MGLELKTVLFIPDPPSFCGQPLPGAHRRQGTEDGYQVPLPRTFTRSTANPLSSLKKVTRSTSPAISSDGVRVCGEESLILIEVYAVGTEQGASIHALPLECRGDMPNTEGSVF